MLLNKWKLKNRIYSKFTLENLERKMKEEGFDKGCIADLMSVFKTRISKYGREEFQKWIYYLDFSVPEEFQDEETAIRFYLKHRQWIESEVMKLEKEIKLSWEIQTEDLENLDDRARKAQLVIRDRLTGIVLDLMD